MLRVISTLTIISTGVEFFQYFTIKININKDKSYSIDVILIILSMFKAKPYFYRDFSYFCLQYKQ